MQNKSLIIIGSIVGLDMSDINHAVFVGETVRGIDNLDSFAQYCRDNKNSITMTAKTDKLDTLATRYKKIQEDAKLPHKTANTFTDKIIYKISKTKDKLKNAIERCEPFPLSRAIVKVDGEAKKLFEDSEINALCSLKVSPSVIIEMYELGTLKDNLMKTYMKHHLENINNKALSDNQKEVLKITSGGVA